MFPKLTKLAASVAATMIFASAANAFVIQDIRIEGIQRTEPGTVFAQLPFTVGDDYTPELATRAIHQLYASGIFKDVAIEREGDKIIVKVVERPAVADVATHGITVFDKQTVEKSLRQVGLAEGRTFDPAMLERADQELRRQYLARGFYDVKITSTVSPLERNRVKVTINVDQGKSARIASIRFIGNHVYSASDLEDEMNLQPSGWFSWYTRKDLYSREKLAADLESLRSFYLNNGYLDFRVDSVQVQINPERSDVYLTLNLYEGPKYTLTATSLSGDMLGLDEEFKKLNTLKLNTTFDAEKVNEVAQKMQYKLSTLGYAFASVTPTPIANKEDNTVAIDFVVDPGRRVYVRHVNVTGNTRTRDYVIRREITQYEQSWFNSESVAQSRDRIDRLGFFDQVAMQPVTVPGIPDEVDLEAQVKERPTGQLSMGVGYSSEDKVSLNAGFAQNNLFGTGKALAVNANTTRSALALTASVSEPFVTTTGISRDWSVGFQRTDTAKQSTDNKQTVTYDNIYANLNFGIPITANDTIYVGPGIETIRIKKLGKDKNQDPLNQWLAKNPNPCTEDNFNQYGCYASKNGGHPLIYTLNLGWGRDTRDNSLAPNRGTYQRLNMQASVPGSKVLFYKATYQYQHYFPITKNSTFMVNTVLGYGDNYGKSVNQGFPFFKTFYQGGIGSVRGYESGSLGQYVGGNYIGGNQEFQLNLELLFPVPGGDRTLRFFGFFDAGNTWATRLPDGQKLGRPKYNQLYTSTGVGLSWLSPLGPLRFSYAWPLTKKEKGQRWGGKPEYEQFQFTIGTAF